MTLLGWTAFHFVWAGAIMYAMACVALRAARTSSPRFRYAVALTALVVMAVTPAIVAAGLRATTTGGAPSIVPVVVAEATAAPVRSWVPPREVMRLAGVMWVVGATVATLRLVVGWFRLQGRRVRARAACPETRAFVRSRAAAVDVLVSDEVTSPALVGILRPVILLPDEPSDREPVTWALRHELTHLARGDHRVNALQRLLEALLFFHPAFLMLSRRVRREREHRCDHEVVARCGRPGDYVRALLAFAAAPAPRIEGGVSMARHTIVERAREILEPAPEKRPGLRWMAVLSLLGVLALLAVPYGEMVPAGALADPPPPGERAPLMAGPGTSPACQVLALRTGTRCTDCHAVTEPPLPPAHAYRDIDCSQCHVTQDPPVPRHPAGNCADCHR